MSEPEIIIVFILPIIMFIGDIMWLAYTCDKGYNRYDNYARYSSLMSFSEYLKRVKRHKKNMDKKKKEIITNHIG